MSQTKEKEAVLWRLYDLYDQFSGPLDLACNKGCASCCTGNVTLTTLEALLITRHIENEGQKGAVRDRLAQSRHMRRFQPRVTPNQLAALCMAGESPPEEACDPSWGRCPLLDGQICSIYPVRPYACRCLLSTRKCEHLGHAEISPFVLTVNTVFMQVIEHVDHTGMSGNLLDVMEWMTSDGHARDDGAGLTVEAAPGMIRNRPLPFLMVPPEHRERIAEMLAALRAISSP